MKLILSTGNTLALLLSIQIISLAQSKNFKFTIHQDYVNTSKCGVLITKYSRTLEIDSLSFQFSFKSKQLDSLLFIIYNREEDRIFEEKIKFKDGLEFRSYIPLNKKANQPYYMRLGNYETFAVEDYGLFIPQVYRKEEKKFLIQVASIFAGIILFMMI